MTTPSAPNTGFLRTPINRRTALKAFGFVGISIAAIDLLAACAPSPAPGVTPGGTPIPGGTMRIGIKGGHPGTVLDPHVLTEGFDTFFGWTFYEQIRRLDGEFAPYDVLSEEISSNADATQWTLRLKQDVEFHNGKTLDADDVIFSFNRILDPASGAIAAGNLGLVSSMSKIDARTVRFDMASPYGWFDLAIADTGALGIVPVDFDLNAPVSTGPFKFVSHDPGVEAVLERFENYHGDAPLLDGVRLIALDDDDARMNALLSGQIDMMATLPPAQIARVQADPKFAVQSLPAAAFTVFTMRTDAGPFSDERVRQAMRLAIDRERVSDVIAGGKATLGSDLYAPFAPATDGFDRIQDVAAAKKLIEQAGAKGTKVVLTVIEGEPAAPILEQNAKEIGLDISVEYKDFNSYFTQGYMEYDFAMDYYPASLQLTYAAMSDGPFAFLNQTHFADDEYNAEFALANAALTDDDRAPHLRRMQEILFERGGYLIPVFPDVLTAATTNVGGLPTANQTSMELAYSIAKIGFLTPSTT